MVGRVDYWSQQKGFGFIERTDGERSLFLHITAVINGQVQDIKRGTMVEFDVTTNTRGGGLIAANVYILGREVK